MIDGQAPEKTHIWRWERSGREMYRRSVFHRKGLVFIRSRGRKSIWKARLSQVVP